MDVAKQLECLNDALRLQHRSVLQYALAAGSVVGLEFQAHAGKLRDYAEAELEDTSRLIGKITALGGDPTTEVAALVHTRDPQEALEQLIESETEVLETLQEAIEPTGREAASEAVEHRLEHIIMRKQEQVDYLLRGQGRPRTRYSSGWIRTTDLTIMSGGKGCKRRERPGPRDHVFPANRNNRNPRWFRGFRPFAGSWTRGGRPKQRPAAPARRSREEGLLVWSRRSRVRVPSLTPQNHPQSGTFAAEPHPAQTLVGVQAGSNPSLEHALGAAIG